MEQTQTEHWAIVFVMRQPTNTLLERHEEKREEQTFQITNDLSLLLDIELRVDMCGEYSGRRTILNWRHHHCPSFNSFLLAVLFTHTTEEHSQVAKWSVQRSL